MDKTIESESGGPYSQIEMEDGTRRRMTLTESPNPSIPQKARVFRLDNLQSQSLGREKGEGAACWFPVEHVARHWLPNARSRWKTNKQGMARLKIARRLESTDTGLYYVRYIDDFPAMPIADNWTDTVVAGFASDKKYVVETSTKVIERCIIMTTDPGDLVVDPTCGSGTTAYVAEQWGRRWITIDTSRVVLALARTRLMAARFPYYYLADNCPQMTQMNTDEDIKNYLRQSASSADKNSSSSSAHSSSPPPDIRKGFVYKRVPHVTLKSIANNPDIREGVTRAEIEAAIRRHAETETLHDQPYEDKNRIRASGPFTVESLSPDRIVSTDEERPASGEVKRASHQIWRIRSGEHREYK